MNKELLLKSDLLEIVFENRNKAYGAYELRKHYTSRLNKALGSMICFTVVVSAFTFLPKKQQMNTTPYIIDDTKLTTVIIPKEKMAVVEPSKNKALPKMATALFTTHIKIVREKDTIAPLDIDLNNMAIGTNNSTGNSGGGPSIVIPEIVGTSGITTVVKPVIDKQTPIDNPDFMPAYPGGMDALQKFLQRNLVNPKDMAEGEEVSVRVSFVVGYDGKLQGFVNAKGMEQEFYKEVVRVLKKMPEWIPGRTNGENIAVNYAIPVKFVPAE